MVGGGGGQRAKSARLFMVYFSSGFKRGLTETVHSKGWWKLSGRFDLPSVTRYTTLLGAQRLCVCVWI